MVGLLLLDDGLPIRPGHAIRETDVAERAFWRNFGIENYQRQQVIGGKMKMQSAGHLESRTADRPDEVSHYVLKDSQ